MNRKFNQSDRKFRQSLLFLYRSLAHKRRRQAWLVLTLMILGAVAEFVTIGAVLPFLALITDASLIESAPTIKWLFEPISLMVGENLLLGATILLVCSAITAAILRLLLTWTSQRYVYRVGHDIGSSVYSRLLRQHYAYYVMQNSSEAIAGVEMVQSVIHGVLLPLIQGVTAAIISMFIIVGLIAIDPLIAIVAAGTMMALYSGVSLCTSRVLRHNSALMAQLQVARVKQIQEGLGGIRDILIDQSQPVYEEAFNRLDSAFRRTQALNLFISAAPRFVVESAGIILIAILAFYLSGRPGGIMAAVPMLGALALGSQRLMPLLQLVYTAWSQITGNGHLLIKITTLMQLPLAATATRSTEHKVKPFECSIDFDRVSFRYLSGPPVLERVSLNIPRGTRVGLIGETGSGKSTLLDLLMALLDPTEGEIRIDGRPLTDAAVRADWQAQIAHVPQSIYLSDSSIAENIAFGLPEGQIDFEAVREAARRAQIDEFIRSQPDGYSTKVGERGVRLSGGQRQRIGIARALYKRAPVLILDEATSALDERTEVAVMDALSGIGHEFTIFMIAHRLSTLAGCDILIRLDRGRVVAMGSYTELVGVTGNARPRSNG